MNAGMKVVYQGDLRNLATHIKSGNQLTTDAPPDNNGKGEAFSPTDLLCTSLASCMITLIGITASSKGIQLGNIEARIEKRMASDPRRVIGIDIEMDIENRNFSEKEKSMIENAAKTCPVAKSLHSDIHQNIHFNYIG